MHGRDLRKGAIGVGTISVLTLVLFGVAIGVRALRGAAALAPADRPRSADLLREPMQFLGRGAALRMDELTPRISAENSQAWRAANKLAFEIAECPTTVEWLATPEGQRFERLLGDLRRGTSDEGLAALALIVELARTTEWNAGLLARTQSAERLAALTADWLRSWSERGATDTTLAEPTLAATLLYGLAMHEAADPLPIVRNAAAYERAQAFLQSLFVDAQDQPTALSRAMRQRHPLAVDGLASKSDGLRALAEEAKHLFSDLDGECGE